MMPVGERLDGVCSCGELTYQLQDEPLFVHACHCLDCKRKAGSSFALTCIVIEADIKITSGSLTADKVSPRSTAQLCRRCRSSIYVSSTAFPATALLQTSSLNNPGDLSVGAHIWTIRKDPWLMLPANVPQFSKAYDRDVTWPASSLKRLVQAMEAYSPD